MFVRKNATTRHMRQILLTDVVVWARQTLQVDTEHFVAQEATWIGDAFLCASFIRHPPSCSYIVELLGAQPEHTALVQCHHV